MLQSQGLAKCAPPTLPDESNRCGRWSARAVPVGDQIKTRGLTAPPGLTDALARANAPLPGQPGLWWRDRGSLTAPGTAAAPGGQSIGYRDAGRGFVRDGLIKRGMDPDTATAFAANALLKARPGSRLPGRAMAACRKGCVHIETGHRNTAYQQLCGHPQGAPAR